MEKKNNLIAKNIVKSKILQTFYYSNMVCGVYRKYYIMIWGQNEGKTLEKHNNIGAIFNRLRNFIKFFSIALFCVTYI